MYNDPISRRAANSGDLVIPPQGFEGARELCRTESLYPAPWIVQVGRVDLFEETALFGRVFVDVNWGHGRAQFSTTVDLDQTLCVHGTFVSVDIRAQEGGGGARVAGLISPSDSGAASPFSATLTQFVTLITDGPPVTLARATLDIPRFARFIADSGGWRQFPVAGLASEISLPPRLFNFRGPGFVFGQAFAAENIPANITIPQGATLCDIVMPEPPGDNNHQTLVTFNLALC